MGTGQFSYPLSFTAIYWTFPLLCLPPAPTPHTPFPIVICPTTPYTHTPLHCSYPLDDAISLFGCFCVALFGGYLVVFYILLRFCTFPPRFYFTHTAHTPHTRLVSLLSQQQQQHIGVVVVMLVGWVSSLIGSLVGGWDGWLDWDVERWFGAGFARAFSTYLPATLPPSLLSLPAPTFSPATTIPCLPATTAFSTTVYACASSYYLSTYIQHMYSM